MRRFVSTIAGGLCALALYAGTVSAQPKPTPPPRKVTDADMAKAQQEDTRPWAKGVSAEKQTVALGLFNEGNKLLRDSLFPAAVAKYKEALVHWDHPAIHYNLALALVNLDQPVEMHAALERAMVHGAAPLGDDKFTRAKDYKLLVEKQLATVEYTVSIPGAKLIFDGKEVLTGPGTWKALVRAGEHSIAARAEGYVPTQLSPKLGGGETSRLTLELFTDKELTREKRKMPVWVPYTVLGAGAVIAGTGALLHNAAKGGFEEYDQGIARCSQTGTTGGCESVSPSLFSTRSDAESNQRLAFVAYGVGGAAVAAGVVLIILNRAESYRIDPFAAKEKNVSIQPIVGRDLAGISATGAF